MSANRIRGDSTLQINGVAVAAVKGMTLLEYLTEQQYVLERIAVEYNGNIVQREQYGEIVLQEEDHIEIVSFVGGG